jgi:hypothetical protein
MYTYETSPHFLHLLAAIVWAGDVLSLITGLLLLGHWFRSRTEEP